MQRKTIKTKKIGQRPSYSQNVRTRRFSFSAILKTIIVLACIGCVLYFSKYLIGFAQKLVGYVSQGTMNIVSTTIGKPMQRDQFGNVNILLVGYGGANHNGGFLADSIMIASWNPELWTVTLLSVPRDLYVYDKEADIRGKVNSVFARSYRRTRDLDASAKELSAMLYKITSIDAPYYALIDFNGFKDLVDAVGGVQVQVPKDFIDTQYPDDKWYGGYITFKVSSWLQNFDGPTALKYARSRHSTSDFSRAGRQQQIIKAIKDKVFSSANLLNISLMRNLYKEYTKMVKTNISIDEMLGMFKYGDDVEHMFSFVYSYECSSRDFQRVTPWCFLYVPVRENFGGASVLLPNGASSTKPNFYDYTQNFWFFVAHNQEYLIENARITLDNQIDEKYARQMKKKILNIEDYIGVKLRKYAFNVVGVNNTEEILPQTTVYVASGFDAPETLDVLRSFIDYTVLVTGAVIPDADIKIILGNDYVDKNIDKKFNFDM